MIVIQAQRALYLDGYYDDDWLCLGSN